MLDLGRLYKRFDRAIAEQTKAVVSKTKTSDLEEIRYNVGFLDGLQAAREAIEQTITEGGE